MQPDLLEQLSALERGATSEAALALFDSLPAVPLETMLGSWRGRGLATGHPLDGMLEAFGWYGKRFDGPEDVHPLLFASPGGEPFGVNPSLVPMGLVVCYASLFRLPVIARPLRALIGVLRTRKPRARLRLTEFRGVATATMIYDALPINDCFRLVDENTLLGVMDMRGLARPFVFVLRREGHRISR
jgi:hypothetical protein